MLTVIRLNHLTSSHRPITSLCHVAGLLSSPTLVHTHHDLIITCLCSCFVESLPIIHYFTMYHIALYRSAFTPLVSVSPLNESDKYQSYELI